MLLLEAYLSLVTAQPSFGCMVLGRFVKWWIEKQISAEL